MRTKKIGMLWECSGSTPVEYSGSAKMKRLRRVSSALLRVLWEYSLQSTLGVLSSEYSGSTLHGVLQEYSLQSTVRALHERGFPRVPLRKNVQPTGVGRRGGWKMDNIKTGWYIRRLTKSTKTV